MQFEEGTQRDRGGFVRTYKDCAGGGRPRERERSQRRRARDERMAASGGVGVRKTGAGGGGRGRWPAAWTAASAGNPWWRDEEEGWTSGGWRPAAVEHVQLPPADALLQAARPHLDRLRFAHPVPRVVPSSRALPCAGTPSRSSPAQLPAPAATSCSPPPRLPTPRRPSCRPPALATTTPRRPKERPWAQERRLLPPPAPPSSGGSRPRVPGAIQAAASPAGSVALRQGRPARPRGGMRRRGSLEAGTAWGGWRGCGGGSGSGAVGGGQPLGCPGARFGHRGGGVGRRGVAVGGAVAACVGCG